MRLIMLRQASLEKPSVFRSLSVSMREASVRPAWAHAHEQIHSPTLTFADDPVQDGLQLCGADLHVLLAQADAGLWSHGSRNVSVLWSLPKTHIPAQLAA